MAFLACVHLALFLALSLSPGNSLVSSWCDHSMLARFLALTVSNSSFSTAALSVKPAESFSVLSSQRRQDVFLHFFLVSSFYSRTFLQATLALSLVVSSFKSVCCDFSIFSAVMPHGRAALCLACYRIPPSYTHSPFDRNVEGASCGLAGACNQLDHRVCMLLSY